MGKIMATKPAGSNLAEDSPSVVAHLEILQSIIQRMAANSSSCKAWCITVVSAILVLVADKGKSEFALIALIPTVLFLSLDVYYLALEKGFRAAYSDFVKKLHEERANPEDIYAINPKGSQSRYQLEALGSFPVWGFYALLVVLVGLAYQIVLKATG
jgi:hypothetical protein